MSAATIIPLPTPLHGMSTDDLETELLGLAGHIAAAECRFLHLLAEFDHRHGWAGDGIRSCAHWLSWRAGMNLRTATERLRVAHSLQHLPRITEAFAAGQVSYSKVRAITRVTGSDTATLTRIAAQIAAGEPEWRHTTIADPDTAERVLLNVALCGTASHIESVVKAIRRRHTPPEDTGGAGPVHPRGRGRVPRRRRSVGAAADPAQIAALTSRDGEKCQFPGCTHTRYLHAHHVRHWLFGGPTDIDNLVLTCSHHHKLIHDVGYRIRRLPGEWEFLRPDGTPIPTTAAPLTGNTESLTEMHTRARLRIDHHTLTPDWDGDRLDLEPILDVLLPKRIKTAA